MPTNSMTAPSAQAQSQAAAGAGESSEPGPSPAHGWLVASAGTGINLALGVLYTWSLFKEAIGKEFGWKGDQLNDPYALCCLVFAFTMIFAGRCQDTFGPRLTASLGGLFVGCGLLLISSTGNYTTWVIGFGVLVGAGLGFGYASATPAALKWFPPARTGLIAGIVVAGFGLAPVYLSPLSKYLLAAHGLHGAMLAYGIGAFIVVCGLAQLLRNPPGTGSDRAQPALGTLASAPAKTGAAPAEMFGEASFYVLWVLYFIGAGAGLMVISSISGMAKKSMGDAAFVAVAVMALGNAAGRISAGLLSDRIGRRTTLFLVLAFQALLMFAAIPITNAGSKVPQLILLTATLVGFNYGANLSLFPSFTKDQWGMRCFGMNYGILFTAWGVGGFALSRVQQMLTSRSNGSFTSSFLTAGVLLIVGSLLTFGLRGQHRPR